MSNLSKKISNKNQLTNVKKFISSLLKKNTSCIIYKNEANKNNVMIKQINDIVFNEKVHLVAEFKNYLILDDSSDFLKR